MVWKITIFNGKIHYKWPFSIAICMFTRGYYSPSFTMSATRGAEINHLWGELKALMLFSCDTTADMDLRDQRIKVRCTVTIKKLQFINGSYMFIKWGLKTKNHHDLSNNQSFYIYIICIKHDKSRFKPCQNPPKCFVFGPTVASFLFSEWHVFPILRCRRIKIST